jgi:hypothetical protein
VITTLIQGIRYLLLIALTATTLSAQARKEFKLPLHWNRLYDYDEVSEISARIAATWPTMVNRISIGKSYEGREMWLLVVNNPDTGPDTAKPAFYSDANIHGNEVQGAETNLYLVWYLLEHYGKVEKITELVDRVSFYILLSVNPDGRAAWFRDPNTSSSQRSPQKPTDDDRDGLFDEDPAEDINGDGEITSMRQKVPMGEGDFRESPDYPGMMERVSGDIEGDYIMLGQEGIDNDGDGRINEDNVGYYDMNRNWPSGWNPNHLQRGSGEYPLSHPETKNVADFVLARPNIAGVQAFHNAGGMILRGPGVVEYGTYPRRDVQVYDKLGAEGEFMLPFYRYMIIYKDLYSVAGGFVNWTYEGLGIFSFTNEMWSNQRLMQGTKNLNQQERRKWEDLLTFGEYYVPWTKFDHPLYGEVELGGSRKMTGRVPPSWLIEEDLHRNAAFIIYHADQMPNVELTGLEVRPAPGGLHYIDIKVRNDRVIPSRSALAADKKVGIPDRLSISGDGIQVVAGGMPQDRHRLERIDLQEKNPRVLRGENGVPGQGDWHVRWIVAGTGSFRIEYEAEKASNQQIEGEIR